MKLILEIFETIHNETPEQKQARLLQFQNQNQKNVIDLKINSGLVRIDFIEMSIVYFIKNGNNKKPGKYKISSTQLNSIKQKLSQ